MPLPKKKELDRIRKKLAKVDPVRILPPNASKVDQFKFDLCKRFVLYLRENQVTQLELAKKLEIDPSRVNEIVKYRIELFTSDRLIEYLVRLQPEVQFLVA